MAENRAEKGLIAKLGDSQIAPPWGIGEMGLTLAVMLIGTLIIGTGVTATISADALNPTPESLLIGWLVGMIVVFIFVLVRWRRHKDRFDALALKSSHWNPILAVMVGIGGSFLASLIAGLGSGDFLVPVSIPAINESNIGALIAAIIFALLAQPLAESLVFQGVVLPRLRATLKPYGGLFVAILLYAIYYYLVFGTRTTGSIAIWYEAIYPVVIALTLSAVRIWSKSTLSSMLAQIGVGAGVIIILFVL